MTIPVSVLDDILRRTDIVRLVGQRVKLTRKGRVMWGCCPFHNEATPSFKVENERGAYKCFGCGKGGDAFRWLMELDGLSFPEAVEQLASAAGVMLPKAGPEDRVREEKRRSLAEVVETACRFFQTELQSERGAAALAYLTERGIGADQVEAFRLGFAPSGSALLGHLRAKGVSIEDMTAAGLVRSDERGARDFFFERVMFPIADGRGRVVAFGGRAIAAAATPKYINTPETPLFAKGTLLYNLATARAAAVKAGTVILAEGYVDVLALTRAGLANAVAPLGTALTEAQLGQLWRLAPEPILAFDGDAAGVRAAHRAARLALPHLKAGRSLRFAFLPAGEDPDSFLGKHDAAALAALLGETAPLVQVIFDGATAGTSFDTPERRAGLARSLDAITATIADKAIAAEYARDLDLRAALLLRTPDAEPADIPRFSRSAASIWRELAADDAALVAALQLDGGEAAALLALGDLGVRLTRIVREPSFKVQPDKAARDQDLGRPTMHLAPLWRFPLGADRGQPAEAGMPALLLPVAFARPLFDPLGRVAPLSRLRLGDIFADRIVDLLALPLDGGRPMSLTGYSLVLGDFAPEPDGCLTVWGSGRAWLDAYLADARATAAETPAHLIEQLHMPFALPAGALITEPRAFELRIGHRDCVLPRSVTEIACPDSAGLARLIDGEMRKKEPPRAIPTVRAPATKPNTERAAA